MGGRYRAFISYTPADRQIARRLQRRLEGYRLDRSLRAAPNLSLPVQPLAPIFRDEDELVPGADLPGRLKKALEDSDFLIVVCSRRSARSRWVAEEVEYFRQLGRRDRILALVADGEPNALARGLPEDLECLPPPLRTTGGLETGADGDPEVLWIDWRGPARRDRRTFLRLVAALLSLDRFDELVRRDRSQDRMRFWRSVALSVALLGLATNAGWAFVSAKRAETRLAVKEATAAFNTGDFEGALNLVARALPAGHGVLFDWSDDDAVELTNAILYRNRLRAAMSGETLTSDGSLAMANTSDGILFRRTATGAQLGKVVLKNAQCCEGGHVATRPDGKAAAVLQWRDSNTYRILIADFGNTPRERWIDWRETDRPEGLWFSPDGRRLLALDKSNRIRVLDLATLGETGRSPVLPGPILCVRPKDDGEIQFLTTGGIGGWRPGSGVLLARPTEMFGSVLQCPDRGRSNLAVTREDREVRVLDMDSGLVVRRRRFEQTIVSADAKPSGLLVVVDENAVASVFDRSDRLIWRALLVHDRRAYTAGVLPPERVTFVGERLLASERGRDVKLWDLAGSPLIMSLPAIDGPLQDMLPSPDGHRIFTRSTRGVLRLWNADAGTSLSQQYGPPESLKPGAAFSRDGRYLAAVLDDLRVVWKTADGSIVHRAFGGQGLKEIAISTHGGKLATRTVAGPINVWKVGDATTPIVTFAPYPGEPYPPEVRPPGTMYWYNTYLDFSEDGERLLVAKRGGGKANPPVKLFDADTGHFIRDVWSGQYGMARYDPAGRRVVVSQEDGNLLLDEAGRRVGRDRRDEEARRPWISIRGQAAFGLNATMATDLPSGARAYLLSDDAVSGGRTMVLHDDGAVLVWRTPKMLGARQLADRICVRTEPRDSPPGACNRPGLLDFGEWGRWGMVVLLAIALAAIVVAAFLVVYILLPLLFAALLSPVWVPFVLLRNRRRRDSAGKLPAATGATASISSS